MRLLIFWIIVIILGMILWIFHPFLDAYTNLIIWTLLLQGSLALSYDILGGYGGELHLGHGAFFGLGAYISMLALIAGIPWGLALVCSAIGGYIFSLVLSRLLVPLTGGTFALTSLVVLLFIKSLFRNTGQITGGTAGLSAPHLGTTGLWFSCTLLLFLICLWVHDSLEDSRFGRALKAVSDDPLAAETTGISRKKIRTQSLILGSIMASLAGGIFPFQSGYINLHSAFGIDVAIGPVVMVLLGGPGTRFGPLIGTVIYVGLQEWLWTHISEGNLAILGAGLIMIGAFFPSGIVGLIKSR
ncbi:branched-chain amino acid ABC transporter permease [Thermodesulfobacteriota bacterium]